MIVYLGIYVYYIYVYESLKQTIHIFKVWNMH